LKRCNSPFKECPSFSVNPDGILLVGRDLLYENSAKEIPGYSLLFLKWGDILL
jgi:hypothetical protein